MSELLLRSEFKLTHYQLKNELSADDVDARADFSLLPGLVGRIYGSPQRKTERQPGPVTQGQDPWAGLRERKSGSLTAFGMTDVSKRLGNLFGFEGLGAGVEG